MVGRYISFWDGSFTGAFWLVAGAPFINSRGPPCSMHLQAATRDWCVGATEALDDCSKSSDWGGRWVFPDWKRKGLEASGKNGCLNSFLRNIFIRRVSLRHGTHFWKTSNLYCWWRKLCNAMGWLFHVSNGTFGCSWSRSQNFLTLMVLNTNQ